MVVSGGFDPLHSGHISYFKSASMLGDKLIIALNSDDWLIKKKTKFFMPFVERKTIKNTYKIKMIVKYDIFFTPLFPKYSFMISVVIKTTGQIRTPTDKLKFFNNEKSKILVPRISAIIALVIKIPVTIYLLI